jgi:hypothetical protein
MSAIQDPSGLQSFHPKGRIQADPDLTVVSLNYAHAGEMVLKKTPALQAKISNYVAKDGAAIRRAWGIIVTSRGVVPSNSPSASTSAGGSA